MTPTMQDDERHYGGSKTERERIWADVRHRKTDAKLPVETELLQDAWYQSEDKVYLVYGRQLDAGSKLWFRLAPVARYEPPKPETPEPKGLGAVVMSDNGKPYVRAENMLNGWVSVTAGVRVMWEQIKQPVEVLSEGVEL